MPIPARGLVRNFKAAKLLAKELDPLDGSALMDPFCYRQTCAVIRDTRTDIARQYLEHGAGEGRDHIRCSIRNLEQKRPSPRLEKTARAVLNPFYCQKEAVS
jgi:hypothetical protein